MTSGDDSLRLVFWGTCDLGKPRNRILMQGLRENGVEVIECHTQVWHDIEDKSRLRRPGARLRYGWRWFSAYPNLLWRYLRLPKHDLVMVGYLGQFDVLLIRPLAWLRRVPLIWDTFLSLYDTVVDDRALVSARHPLAYLLYAWEWLALRMPELILTDTRAHGRFFAERFGAKPTRIVRVLVGAEPRAFMPSARGTRPLPKSRPYRVLFYGQFIPLHGMDVIARAMHLCADEDISWDVIGDGQQTEQFRALLEHYAPTDLTWTPWVPYETLIRHIHAADLCLGIFGTSDKAARVIPNKVYQVVAAGRALITADTPAARELLSPGPGVILVPSGDPEALAQAIREMRQRCPLAAAAQLAGLATQITPRIVVRELVERLPQLCDARRAMVLP